MFLKCNFCVNETETNPTNNNQPQKQKQEQPIKKKETWEMKLFNSKKQKQKFFKLNQLLPMYMYHICTICVIGAAYIY